MKTPDEIKKGLFCCWEDGCTTCPYDDDCTMGENFMDVARDAITYIQQLETRLAQVERERDAAVDDLENASPCFACYHFISNKGACKGDMRCHDEQFKAAMWHLEYKGPDWQWRGVCVENTKEDTTDEPT